MEDKKKAFLELAEAFIKNELALDAYYGLCVDRIPEFKDQWLLLSAQERGHAGVFKKIMGSIEENPSKWTMGKYNAPVVNLMNEEIAQLIEEIKKGEVVKRYIVTFAVGMEASMIERDIRHSFRTSLPEFQVLLSKVADETAAHRQLLMDIDANLKE